MVIKFSEKESFIKSFLLFFSVIILFLLYIFYDNVRDETAHIRNNIFLEMKSYSLGFKDARFKTSKIKKRNTQVFYTLYEDKESLYLLTPLPDSNKKEIMMIASPLGTIMVPYSSTNREVFKVSYPQVDYSQKVTQMQRHLLWQLLFFGIGGIILSLLAAWYTLNPLRSSLRLLEDFIKDIIHDLNTPLTSMMLNLKMIDSKEEEIESIRTATQTIEMLHHNLDAYLREQKQTEEMFSLDEIVNRYVSFFTPLYDYLDWDVQIKNLTLYTDKQAFERVIYNLLSNACKYNTNKGKIEISVKGTILSIRNSSYGVSNPHRVFERFYKENERGLGIGLHIVDKLCLSMEVEKKFSLEGTDVIVALECKNIISNTHNSE
ncbi:MAG: Two-component sensor histidine kinase [uncultured Sulfurovum sp.]|uniref:histidine kinase n=1 Tax=uncultured Sulfurovum sp. TaxID=269237 RepID=A0A6S6T3J8_9BACT|nr:MAG: Two-component sensor histidine kinase [uncultured Sulfurovum sp.]